MKHSKLLAGVLTALLAGQAWAESSDTHAKRDDIQRKLEAANERLEQAAREVADLSAELGTAQVPRIFMHRAGRANRAMLGIAIGDEGKPEDAGVRVLSVSPGGPADKAGLKADDVITELNGKSLRGDKDNEPSEKLLTEMSQVAPGDDVTLKYRRDGKNASVKLQADRLPTRSFAARFRNDPMRFEHGSRHEDDFDDMDWPHGPFHAGAFRDIELVPLTAKLGQYFGAEKGLLVVRAPRDQDLKLEEGDVLVDIDGRVPANSGHAFRILGSYQPGEKIALNVLRQRKKMALSITVPEWPHVGMPMAPRPPTPPAPPREP